MTASVLDRQRLGKQRVECLQILRTLKQGEWSSDMPKKRTAWYNHPAVQMWKGYEAGLMLYLYEICAEWIRRGYKDTCWQKAIEVGFRPPNTDQEFLIPSWIGNEMFHKSHQSNLLRKNSDHYGQFFLGVPNDLPYVWPSKL
jgi:hypothetical protein